MAGKRRSPGPAAEAEMRAAWVALPAQGVSNSEACRLVGVDRKTGVRWRHGQTVRDLRRACPALSTGEGRLSRKFAASVISARMRKLGFGCGYNVRT